MRIVFQRRPVPTQIEPRVLAMHIRDSSFRVLRLEGFQVGRPRQLDADSDGDSERSRLAVGVLIRII